MKIKLIITTILVYWNTSVLFCQTNYLTKTQVIEDINYLTNALEETQVNTYFKYPKNLFQKDIEREKKQLLKKNNITPFDFYLAFQPAIVNLKDGHTSLNPYELFSKTNYLVFPLYVTLSPDKIIVKNIQSNYKGKIDGSIIGKNIVRINNISQKNILEIFRKYVSAESYTTKLNYGGKYYFTFLFNLLMKGKNPNIATIEFFDGSKINVALIDKKNWKGDEYGNENLKSYQYAIDDSGKFALLTFNTFYHLDTFRLFLSEMFSNIKSKKIENLIIDIRNNNGGNSDLGDELLKYISTSPFAQYDRTYLKFSKIYKETFAKYSSLSKDSLARYLNKKEGFIDTIRKSNRLIQPRLGDERFGGNVFLLTSPYTYSSAADFANAFKYYHLGKIVGEETGGYIISQGEGVVTKLPRSKINVELSSSKDFDIGASDDDWHGVKPDYKVKSEESLNYVIKNLIK